MSYYTPIQTLVARKEHRCTNCGESINAGDAYKRWSSVENVWFTSKMHPECLQWLLDDADGGEFEYTPYDGERPKP
jgi:ribosomal protein S27AE